MTTRMPSRPGSTMPPPPRSTPPRSTMPPPPHMSTMPPHPMKENFNGVGCVSCPMQPKSATAQVLAEPDSPCMNCTSIYMAMRDRSPFDRAYLRAYNKLPGMYVTNLDSLVFAP